MQFLDEDERTELVLQQTWGKPAGRAEHRPAGRLLCGVGLEQCSDAVCTMPMRASQRALDKLTPGNGRTSRTQSLFL